MSANLLRVIPLADNLCEPRGVSQAVLAGSPAINVSCLEVVGQDVFVCRSDGILDIYSLERSVGELSMIPTFIHSQSIELVKGKQLSSPLGNTREICSLGIQARNGIQAHDSAEGRKCVVVLFDGALFAIVGKMRVGSASSSSASGQRSGLTYSVTVLCQSGVSGVGAGESVVFGYTTKQRLLVWTLDPRLDFLQVFGENGIAAASLGSLAAPLLVLDQLGRWAVASTSSGHQLLCFSGIPDGANLVDLIGVKDVTVSVHSLVFAPCPKPEGPFGRGVSTSSRKLLSSLRFQDDPNSVICAAVAPGVYQLFCIEESKSRVSSLSPSHEAFLDEAAPIIADGSRNISQVLSLGNYLCTSSPGGLVELMPREAPSSHGAAKRPVLQKIELPTMSDEREAPCLKLIPRVTNKLDQDKASGRDKSSGQDKNSDGADMISCETQQYDLLVTLGRTVYLLVPVPIDSQVIKLVGAKKLEAARALVDSVGSKGSSEYEGLNSLFYLKAAKQFFSDREVGLAFAYLAESNLKDCWFTKDAQDMIDCFLNGGGSADSAGIVFPPPKLMSILGLETIQGRERMESPRWLFGQACESFGSFVLLNLVGNRSQLTSSSDEFNGFFSSQRYVKLLQVAFVCLAFTGGEFQLLVPEMDSLAKGEAWTESLRNCLKDVGSSEKLREAGLKGDSLSLRHAYVISIAKSVSLSEALDQALELEVSYEIVKAHYMRTRGEPSSTEFIKIAESEVPRGLWVHSVGSAVTSDRCSEELAKSICSKCLSLREISPNNVIDWICTHGRFGSGSNGIPPPRLPNTNEDESGAGNKDEDEVGSRSSREEVEEYDCDEDGRDEDGYRESYHSCYQNIPQVLFDFLEAESLSDHECLASYVRFCVEAGESSRVLSFLDRLKDERRSSNGAGMQDPYSLACGRLAEALQTLPRDALGDGYPLRWIFSAGNRIVMKLYGLAGRHGDALAACPEYGEEYCESNPELLEFASILFSRGDYTQALKALSNAVKSGADPQLAMRLIPNEMPMADLGVKSSLVEFMNEFFRQRNRAVASAQLSLATQTTAALESLEHEHSRPALFVPMEAEPESKSGQQSDLCTRCMACNLPIIRKEYGGMVPGYALVTSHDDGTLKPCHLECLDKADAK